MTWYWRDYVRSQIWLILVAFVFMAGEGGTLGALSYMVRPMFDEIFVAGQRDAVLLIAMLVSGLFIFRAIAGFSQQVLLAMVARRVGASLKSDLVRHMLRLDGYFFQKNSPGTLMERVRGDTMATTQIISGTFSSLGRDLISVISLLAVAISVDWLWTLIAVLGAPLLFFPILALQALVRRKARQARQAAGSIATRLDEIFHGITTIKLNAIEEREAQRFEGDVDKFVQAEIKTLAATAGIPSMMDIVAAIGFFGVLIYGGHQIIDGEKSVGEFMSFFAAISLLFEPLRRLGRVSGQWQAALASMERLTEVLNQRPRVASPAAPKPLPEHPDRAMVSFENVDFSYGENSVLDGLSFVAEPGKTTALVGPSGAGKTTVFNLITRLLDPQSGQITISGTDIREYDLSELRSLFSVVSQETPLFDETLRDNILLGAEASDASLESAITAAHVADFLPNLSEGLDTPAGPRGSALSGGQRQRVAIARALLRDRPFLLLDEATSALDAKSESIVQEALEQLSKGRTTLVIAHRLSTIRNADKIVVMDKGRVVDEGSHEDLIKKSSGIYANLYRLQFSGTE